MLLLYFPDDLTKVFFEEIAQSVGMVYYIEYTSRKG